LNARLEDDAGFLLSIDHEQTRVSFQRFDYTLNSVNNRTGRTEIHDGLPAVLGGPAPRFADMIRHVFPVLAASVAAFSQLASVCAQNETVAPPAGTLGKGARTVLEPFFSAAVEVPAEDGKMRTIALRGLLVRAEKGWLCYDMDRAGVVATWEDAAFDLKKTNLATYKGLESGAVIVNGTMREAGVDKPGKWRGIYLQGRDVVAVVEREGRKVHELLTGPAPRELSAEEAAPFLKGGSPRWGEKVSVAGVPAAQKDEAYVVDEIPLPDENPWNAWMRPTGVDFFPDGRMAIATLGGDVWIAHGLDEKLSRVEWRRFAAGLREPLGLRIVDGRIHVGGRDQITRLHDLNEDGEADFYECVNAGRELVSNFHAFAYDLQTDRAGNFYFATGGNQLGPDLPWHGPLFRVSADGAKMEAVARGLRAPNGLTIGPDDSIYVADNQGQWIPSSKISRVRPGGFYGFVADPNRFPKAKAPAAFDAPVCYLPMTWDNSSGGGAFCLDDRWGPFKGRMLHTSFGAAALFAVFEQRVGEVAQAAVIKFPARGFQSGIHRARFGPHDGQLYVAGTKGWQSRAVRDGTVARVRYTGAPVRVPIGSRVEHDALVVDFAVLLDRAVAEDPQNYAGEQWNYLWHAKYGSPDVPPSNPKKTGRDPVEITAVRLSDDAKSVRISIAGLAPVMQLQLKANLRAQDGAELPIEIVHTINAVPEARAAK
jgi:glucose/arabinose dehydrogenase